MSESNEEKCKFEKEKVKQFFVYLLESSGDQNTYVGATIDLNRRLRQHNKEIKGGARQTSRKVVKGQIWERICYVKNFPTWSSALQFEWKWKFLSRKISFSMLPVERRMIALHQLIHSIQSTSKSIPFQEWEIPIEIIFEKDELKEYYKQIK